jgi:hypothetical protein
LTTRPSSRTLTTPHAATPPVVGYLNKAGVLTAPLLPRPRFGMRAELGAHQALLGVHRICWRPNSVVAQLSQL